ncbi:MAG TPA: c-type cytochrome [Chitinophagaceae bacterium]
MQQKFKLFTVALIVSGFATISLQSACSSDAATSENQPVSAAPEKKELSKSEMIARGQYLSVGCNDCHSPKVFTEHGFHFDSTKLFSGHPQGSPLPSVDKKALQPGYWLLFSGDITAFVGPWGMSFSANLTPDSTTGIGAWSEETFIKTMRSGKHLGQDGGRPIMPPMPWEVVAKLTDEDIKSIYAYLQSLPAVKNQVPAYMPPPEVAKMK